MHSLLHAFLTHLPSPVRLHFPCAVWQCPAWEYEFSSGHPRALPRTELGEEVLLAEDVGPQSVTWTATEAGEWFMICQAPPHCRLVSHNL